MDADRARYWCKRCERPLSNDPSLKADPADTVTARGERFEHDACGGTVELSMPVEK
jgi:hypothetical protein